MSDILIFAGILAYAAGWISIRETIYVNDLKVSLEVAKDLLGPRRSIVE